MFEYIRGKLTVATPERATIEVGGLGYRLYIPFNCYTKLPAIGKEVLLFVYAHIREDSHRYFGFLTEQERDLFEQLNAISGVGPKTALALIGHMELAELYLAISQKNAMRLCIQVVVLAVIDGPEHHFDRQADKNQRAGDEKIETFH